MREPATRMRCCSGAATATRMRCRLAAASRFLFTRQGELWRDQRQGDTNTNECSHELHVHFFLRERRNQVRLIVGSLAVHQKWYALASLNHGPTQIFFAKAVIWSCTSCQHQLQSGG